MKVPHKCPVCEGIGGVSEGYYNRHPGHPFSSTGTGLETCRTCKGEGIVWDPMNIKDLGSIDFHDGMDDE